MHVSDLRDDDFVGKNVEVLWPDDGLFYPATVISARGRIRRADHIGH